MNMVRTNRKSVEPPASVCNDHWDSLLDDCSLLLSENDVVLCGTQAISRLDAGITRSECGVAMAIDPALVIASEPRAKGGPCEEVGERRWHVEEGTKIPLAHAQGL